MLLEDHPYPLLPQLRDAKQALESPESLDRGIQVQVEREVWDVAGCPEFFQRLQFDVSKTHSHTPWILLTAPASKLDRKTLHFAATAVLAVFGESCNTKLP